MCSKFYAVSPVMAGIVTFNPEIELLKKDLAAAAQVVPFIYIVDNGSRNAAQIEAAAASIFFFPIL